MGRKRLFLPGPTEVAPEILDALATPQIGHRSAEYRELHRRVTGKVRTILGTEGSVFLFTSSSSGVWEGAVRNLVRERALFAVQGAFSERWMQVALANGKAADAVRVEPGRAIRAEAIDEALATGRYDAVAVVHNETATGVMNDLGSIADAVRRHPGVSFLVDAVSSMTAVPIPVDAWGIDVCFAGTQKALALPPGLAVAAVSPRALEKAATIPDRGYYFDFVTMARHDAKGETPATPATPQIHALDRQTDRILAEGLEARYARHASLARTVQEWASSRFALFAETGYESPTVTCVANRRGVDVAALLGRVAERGMAVANGYGELRDKTFRIAHMGDATPGEVRELLAALDEALSP